MREFYVHSVREFYVHNVRKFYIHKVSLSLRNNTWGGTFWEFYVHNESPSHMTLENFTYIMWSCLWEKTLEEELFENFTYIMWACLWDTWGAFREFYVHNVREFYVHNASPSLRHDTWGGTFSGFPLRSRGRLQMVAGWSLCRLRWQGRCFGGRFPSSYSSRSETGGPDPALPGL